MRNSVLAIFTCLAVIGLLAAPMRVQASEWTGETDNEWWDSTNWSGDIPWYSGDQENGAQFPVIGSTTDLHKDRENYDRPRIDRLYMYANVEGTEEWQSGWSEPTTLNMYDTIRVDKYFGMSHASDSTDTVLNIHDGAWLDLSSDPVGSPYIGANNNNATATVNIKNGGSFTTGSGATFQVGSFFDQGDTQNTTGVINIEAGGKADIADFVMLGRKSGGVGKIKAGGDFSTGTDVTLGNEGTGGFTVHGTWDAFENPGTPGTITVGGDFRMDLNNEGSNLGFFVDDGGATTIEVGGNFILDAQASPTLDLGWLEGFENTGGTWTAMTWDGGLLDNSGANWFSEAGKTTLTIDDVPMSLAGDVDPDIWSVEFTQTDSGYMTITAVPEPSTLALLALAGLLLMKRRRV